MSLSTLLNFIIIPNLYKLIFFPIAVVITSFTPKTIIDSIPFGRYDILIYLICVSILTSSILYTLNTKYNKLKNRNNDNKYLNKQIRQGYIRIYKELSLRHKELIDTFLKTKNKSIPLIKFNRYDFKRDNLIYTYKENNMIFVRLKNDFYNTLKSSRKALVD